MYKVASDCPLICDPEKYGIFNRNIIRYRDCPFPLLVRSRDCKWFRGYSEAFSE